MTFLFPLYLLGALALGVPILLHLRKRPPKDHVVFSSLMFLQKTPERLTRRSQIERWLLLALRCLALLLLAGLFARPLLRSDVLPDAGGEGRRLLLLLDTSASMQRDGLWPQVVSHARDWITLAKPEDELALVSFDTQLHPVMTFEEWSALPPGERREQAESRLTKLLPGWYDTDLGRSLTGASELLLQDSESGASKGSPTENPKALPFRHFKAHDLIVFSDFQEGAARESLTRNAWPEEVIVHPVPLEPRQTGNLAPHFVAQLDPEDDSRPSGAERGAREISTEPRVRISSDRDTIGEDFTLTWKGHDEPRISGRVPSGGSRTLTIPLPSSTANAAGAAGLPAGARLLELSGDNQPFDNVLHLAPLQPVPLHVLYVDSVRSADETTTSPLFYLRRALQPGPALEPSLSVLAGTDVIPSSFDGIQAAVVRGELPDPATRALGDFISRGGVAIHLMTEEATGATLTRLLDLPQPLMIGEAPVKDYALLAGLEFDHPVLAPFARSKVRDFTRVHFWRHRLLELPQPRDPALPSAQVLARFDDASGSPALLASRRGAGHLFVFTSGWEPKESQLALSSKFVPLLFSMLSQGGMTTEQPALFVGSPLPLPSAAAPTEWIVRGPDGIEHSVPGSATQFAGSDLPGFYTLRPATAPASEPPSRVYAVNLAPAESRVEAFDPALVLEDVGIKLAPKGALAAEAAVTASDPATRKRLADLEKESQQKLWKWLALAALGFLVLESLLAALRSRPRASKEAPVDTSPVSA